MIAAKKRAQAVAGSPLAEPLARPWVERDSEWDVGIAPAGRAIAPSPHTHDRAVVVIFAEISDVFGRLQRLGAHRQFRERKAPRARRRLRRDEPRIERAAQIGVKGKQRAGQPLDQEERRRGEPDIAVQPDEDAAHLRTRP